MIETKNKPAFDTENKAANLFTVEHPKYSETIYEIPQEIVSGTMRVIQLHEELSIVIINQHTGKDRAKARPNIEEEILQMAFCLSGDNIKLTIPRMDTALVVGKGESLFGSPGAGYELEFPANQYCDGISIHVTPAFLARFIEPEKARMSPEFLQFMKNPKDSAFYNKEKITPAMGLVIHQILHCPYEDSLKHIFLESKVLELVTLRLEQLQTDGSASIQYSLSPEDKNRIQSAREIVLANMDNPPSLGSLAKKVNVNINKLKYGFKELFGTTVFAYLREERLNRARLLLEEGAYSVTEAANLVGYNNLSHFTCTFKKYFGINPGSFVKKRRH